MTVMDRLRRADLAEQMLARLVALLQADEITPRFVDDLDQAVRDADTLLSDVLRDTEHEPADEPSQDQEGHPPVHDSSIKNLDSDRPPTGYQQCRRCEVDKPFDDFAPVKHTANGRDPWCRDCKYAIDGRGAEPPREAPREEPAKRKVAERKGCNADGCKNSHTAKGYCSAHYYRVRRHGDPMAHIPLGSKPSGQPLADTKIHTPPTDGSVPPGGPSGSKPDGAGSTPARPATNPDQTYQTAVDETVFAQPPGPRTRYTLARTDGTTVLEDHPAARDPDEWAAMLGQVHEAVTGEPVDVTHQALCDDVGNGQGPTPRTQRWSA